MAVWANMGTSVDLGRIPRVLRRLLTASFITLLIAGALPAGVLAVAPVATPQSVTTDEDTGVAITLAGTDAELDPLTFDVVAGPAHGSLTGTAPDLTYTPATNFNGPDSFTFTANDGTEDSGPATVDITVNPVNDPPVAVDDPGTACGPLSSFGGSFPIPEDWSGGSVGYEGWFALVGSCAPMRNDTDPDGDELTFELVGDPAHGDATFLPDGFLAYDPAPDYSTPGGDQPGGTWVSDTIHYRVFDGNLYSDTASYRLWVSPVNDAPSFTAGPDVTVNEDSGAYVGAWASDIDPGPNDGYQTVDFVIDAVSNPSLFASAPSISSTGVLSFKPALDLYGLSTVTVHAQDDGGLEDYGVASVSPDDTSDSVVFTISVTPINDAPAPADTSSTMPWGFTSLISLSASDAEGDATTAFALVTTPEHGDVTIDPAPFDCDGQMPNVCTGPALYTPDLGYTGPDSFTYTATDGTDTSAPATVSITVTDNAAPVCDDASSTGPEEAAQGGNLTCSDAENEELTYSPVTGASNGAAIVAPDGSWGYQPNANFSGTDSFTFQATDANGVSNTATMSITVNGVNDVPVCTGFAPAAVAEDTQQSGTITTCADVETGTLTYSKVGDPLHGSAAVNADGSWTYTPAANYNGTDSLTFRASDGTAFSGTATISITVTPVNDAPVATAAAVTTSEDTSKAITLAGSDVESSPLTYSVVTWPTHGTLSGIAPNLTYTPAANYHGPDSFTFKVNDGALDSAPATVSLTVTPVNDAPVCTGATGTGAEDTLQSGTLGPCSDVDGNTLAYSRVANAAHGSATVAANGDWTYTPVANYTGLDSFAFRATDGILNSASTTVSITVTPVNDAPVATAAAVTTAEDTSKAITLAGSDVESSPLTFTVVTLPAARHPERDRAQPHLHAGGELPRSRQHHVQGQRRGARLRSRHRVHHGHVRQRRARRPFGGLRVRRIPVRGRHDSHHAQRPRQRHIGAQGRR